MMQLKPGAHIHFMGICGTAMSSLAGLMQGRGFKVTGSDQNPYPPMSTQLAELGIEVTKGYKAENLNPKPDFVIVGNVISRNNPEAEALLKTDIPYTSLPKAMGEFVIEDRESVVISGTHGKTTTTSLMSWVADQVGVGFGYMIGGIPKNFSRSFKNPTGPYFIIEGDEYDTAFFDKVPKFIHYRPRHVILTSVEFDHADIYKDFAAVKSAFFKLAELTPENGTFISWAENKDVQEIAKTAKTKNKFSYGINQGDYQAHHINTQADKTTFEVIKNGKSLGEFSFALSGKYNILNALSVIALSEQVGWPLDKVKSAFKTFKGVKRRQEILGEPKGILVIEDFAHHPTAVSETLSGIKDKYPNRKVHAVFEPRSATSRRKIFQKQYVESFKFADLIYIMQAFDQAKIVEEDRFSAAELVADIKNSGKNAKVFESVDEIVLNLKAQAQKGDLIIIMSNGGFDGIYDKLLIALG